MLHPIILAGGVGTRLWPLSRSALPKQFVNFPLNEDSLFAATLKRLEGLDQVGPTSVVCNTEHRFLVAEQLQQAKDRSNCIMLEPIGRNTAPAIAIAALQAQQSDPAASLLVMPADHVIENVAVFHEVIAVARRIAEEGKLVTFGIVPGSPETGYGYIQKGAELETGEGFSVARFVEKPDLATAESYLAEGNYFWNSGMFLFRADTYLAELEKLAPDIFEACHGAFQKLEIDADFLRIPMDEFSACRSESIDYAVMEKTSLASMVPLDAGWSDLGAWDSIWEQAPKDEQGNAVSGDVIPMDANNNYLQAQSRLLAVLGMDNTVVIETQDAVLVAAKDQVQNVKDLVTKLQEQGRKEKDHHAMVYRPWGSFESLAQGIGYQVKHIVVNPGAAISLQRHQHRSEHWTVVKGSALIYCDGKEFTLQENESTFIPLGSKHRLSNPGQAAVEIIEVQVGAYLGEDDIERFEDLYGR